MTHRRHHKSCITYGYGCSYIADSRFTCYYRLVKLCLYSFFFKLKLIVRKIQRVRYRHCLVPLNEACVIHKHFYSSVCMNSEIPAAFRTSIIICFNILCKNRFLTDFTLSPKALRNIQFFISGFYLCICLFEHISKHDNTSKLSLLHLKLFFYK